MRDGVLRTPTSLAGVLAITATTLAGAAGGQAGSSRPVPAPRQADTRPARRLDALSPARPADSESSPWGIDCGTRFRPDRPIVGRVDTRHPHGWCSDRPIWTARCSTASTRHRSRSMAVTYPEPTCGSEFGGRFATVHGDESGRCSTGSCAPARALSRRPEQAGSRIRPRHSLRGRRLRLSRSRSPRSRSRGRDQPTEQIRSLN